MPISVALLFCIPIGFAFYFEARWLIRYATGRYGLRERRGALAFGAFGGLLIPIVYCADLAESAVSGMPEKMFAVGVIILIGMCIAAFAGWVFVSEKKEAK